MDVEYLSKYRANLYNRKNMFHVYILISKKDKKTYLGSTNNLKRRISKHNKGKTSSTKNRRPLELIYKEELDLLSKARKREKYLKSRKGRRELKEIFKKLDIGS